MKNMYKKLKYINPDEKESSANKNSNVKLH